MIAAFQETGIIRDAQERLIEGKPFFNQGRYVVGDTTYLVRICLEYICVGVMVGDEITITDRRLDRYGTRLDNIVEDLIDICALPEVADELEYMTQFNRPRKSFYTAEMGEW